MKNMHIKISVAMSTYNGSKYLNEQLASILNQTYLPFQIVISDDCSTDNTLEILNYWKSKYPELIEIYQQTQNVGFNNNFGYALSKIRGDYVALCDQDDVWHVDKLKILVQNVHAHPHFNVFHHDESIMGEPPYRTDLPHWLPFQGKGVGILFVLNRLTGHKLFFDSNLLKEILPIPSGIIYDWWINVVVAVHGYTFYIDQKLMDYRKHAESAYFSDLNKQLRDVTKPIQIALNVFGTIKNMTNMDSFYLKKFKKIYIKHRPHQFDFNLFFFLVRNRNVFFQDYYTPFKGIKRQIFNIRLCRAFAKW